MTPEETRAAHEAIAAQGDAPRHCNGCGAPVGGKLRRWCSRACWTSDAAIVSRFWSKVDKSGGPDACWPWTGKRSTDGYGQFVARQKTVMSARMAIEVGTGLAVPVGMVAMHSCDNPPCCNPKHLWLGTQADNIRDRNSKGRANTRYGEDNRASKLANADIHDIRGLLRSCTPKRRIARLFSVDPATIRGIASGRLWGHLQEPKPC